MDSGTHFVMGIALGGLALADPVVASHPMTFAAVMAGTIIGQQAPDIDTVLKLRNNAIYIRHHRGITHSIPAVLIWPLLITGVLALVLPSSDIFHVWLWTQLAVFLHVFVDIFNAYGTQALRPFSKKWVALAVINTFDPFIFGIHCLGILLWIFGADPVVTFSIMYFIIVLYYILRFSLQKAVKSAVHREIKDEEFVIVAPTMKFFQWKVAAKSKTHFYVGRSYRRTVNIYDKFKIEPIPKTALVTAALKDPNIDAFLSFSPIHRWEIAEIENGLSELRLIDLRYRSNDHYPFVAVAHLDQDLNIVNSYTGWIFSEEKLMKKLQIGAGNE
ncbi:metal-dependent hydrolase [Solibacillus daqui]|uniref:metal-dependent hydrolase n=1 Tax=Solibacillus daqui TaxID=2912187 RepID=UPI002366CC52|nr:metal-dependent hydrolase [Solibacillus daqui]